MEDKPLVSIIVNCYNGEKYLRETIDSILNQTYHNYEVIFWDNQSTDSTASIIKSYKNERFNFYYAPKHTTLGEARNLALDKIKGQFLTFLDSDDVWERDFLERAVGVLSILGLMVKNLLNITRKRTQETVLLKTYCQSTWLVCLLLSLM